MSDDLIWNQYPIDTGTLPASWRVAPIEELATSVRSGFPSGKHNSEGRGIPHLRPMNVSRTGNIDLSDVKCVEQEDGVRLQPGDVLFNNTNSPVLIGKTAAFHLEGDWAFSNHMTRITVGPDIDYRFLALQLHFLWMSGYFQALCVNHVNQASVPGKTLSRFVPVVVPKVSEQHRIVEAIEAAFSNLDAGVAYVEAARKRLLRLREQILLPIWTTDAPLAPLRKLLAEPLINGRSVRSRDGGFPVLRLTAIRNGAVKLEERKEGDWSAEDALTWLVRKGDFLVSRGNGTLSLVGRGALVVDEPDSVAFPDTLIRVRIDSTIFNDHFLALAWNSPTNRRAIEALARTTAGIYKVNQAMLEEIELPVPDVREQVLLVQRIEHELSIVDGLERDLEAQLARAQSLRRSVLHAAFAGRLSSHDFSDESATVLLDHIANGRAADIEHHISTRGQPSKAGAKE